MIATHILKKKQSVLWNSWKFAGCEKSATNVHMYSTYCISCMYVRMLVIVGACLCIETKLTHVQVILYIYTYQCMCIHVCIHMYGLFTQSHSKCISRQVFYKPMPIWTLL
jgi:hypothetical protein